MSGRHVEVLLDTLLLPIILLTYFTMLLLFFCYASYLAIRDAQKAANCLIKRTDLLSLQSAIHIMVCADCIDSAKVYTQKFVQESMLNLDWSSAENIIRIHPSFRVRILFPFLGETPERHFLSALCHSLRSCSFVTQISW